jgi:hypothetical protein
MPAKGRDLAPPTYAREFTLRRERDSAVTLVAFMLVLVESAYQRENERMFSAGEQGTLPGFEARGMDVARQVRA